MPVMDGDQFMEELSNKHMNFNIPIIMLTAAGMKEDLDSAEILAKNLGIKFKYVIKLSLIKFVKLVLKTKFDNFIT